MGAPQDKTPCCDSRQQAREAPIRVRTPKQWATRMRQVNFDGNQEPRAGINMLLTATTRRVSRMTISMSCMADARQWATELNHVTQIVGGVTSQESMRARTAFCSHPFQSSSKPLRAVLNETRSRRHRGRSTEVLRRIEPTGALDLIKASQLRVLASPDERCEVQSLVEQEAMDGAAAYKPASSSMIVRNGIWRELEAPSVRIDANRRNLQRLISSY